MQEPKGEGNLHGGRVAYSWDRVASRSLLVASALPLAKVSKKEGEFDVPWPGQN